MKKEIIYILSVFTFVFTSCEKVIEVNLDDAEQKLVIEAEMSSLDNQSYVKLSKSLGVSSTEQFENISNASITISDNQGNTFNLLEETLNPGTYSVNGLKTEANRVYNLNVVAEGQTYTATSTSSSITVLDSLSFVPTSGNGFGAATGGAQNYMIFYHFNDPASENNYYRFKLTNLTDPTKESGTFYIVSDNLFNGQAYAAPFFADFAEAGEEVMVELISMDEANYRYLYTLANTLDTSPFSAAPANPASNLNNDALGYFGAYAVDTMYLTLPE